MKKNKILLALLTSACVGMTAGCGEAKYIVRTETSDAEYGSITGGGNYTNGQSVSVKIYPNDGCYLPETGAALSFIASDETFNRDITLSELTEIRDDQGNIAYYEYPFKIQLGSEEEIRTYGTYKAQFSCRTNTTADVATSVAAERTVEFKVLDGEGNERVDVIVPSQTVNFNAKINETSYIDGIEGKIVWYRDTAFTTKYNFNDGVTDNFTLYGKEENATPKDIVADAIKNFEKAKFVEMTINNDVIEIQNYTKDPAKYKDMDIMVYEKSVGNVLKFMINDDSYYEVPSATGGDYYKLPFSGTGFDAFDIAKVNMFFKHMDVNIGTDTTFIFEKAKGEGDVPITETIDGQVCYKYLVKDSEQHNLYMEFFIRNGYVYKTIDASGEVNLIKYPTKELSELDPENIRDLFLINLSSNNAILNTALSEINASWENALMVRPAKGETIESLLTTNTTVKDLLRKYDYVVKDADGDEINTNTYFINGNKNLTIFVEGEYAPVETAWNALKDGGFGIKTEVTVFGETYSKECNVAAASNVFELPEKPGTMHSVIWSAIQTLKDMPTTYYRFDYDSVTGVYSFYENKNDNVPFITIKLNDGKISTMNYFEIDDDDGDVTTYLNTFTYTAE